MSKSMKHAPVDGLKELPVKGFLLFPVIDEGPPAKATVEPCPDPKWTRPGMPEIAEEAGIDVLPGLKLTMPGGSQWWLAEETWEWLLGAVRAAREHAASEAS